MAGRFKVVSDGSRRGTKIFAPDGMEISDQIKSYKIVLEQTAGEIPKLTLEIVCPVVEVTAEPEGFDFVDGDLVQEVAAGTWSDPNRVEHARLTSG